MWWHFSEISWLKGQKGHSIINKAKYAPRHIPSNAGDKDRTLIFS